MSKKFIIIILLLLVILSGCGDTYNAGGSISIDDHSKNTEGQVVVSTEVDSDVNIDNDKSTNNTNNNIISDSSVKNSNEYLLLLNEYNQLKEQNDELNNKISELETQTNDIPVIEYKDLNLSIDGIDIIVNKNKSMITINGREYFSKEILENLVPDDKNLTIENDTLFIGKVITEKSSLFDEVIVDNENISKTNNSKDSYGNIHTDVLYPRNYHAYIIFNLNRKFSLLKFKLAVQENGYSDAIITIKADDAIVYTSPKLIITTEPFDVIDIPINYCSLLTIKIDSGTNDGFGKGFDCIISEPIVYN